MRSLSALTVIALLAGCNIAASQGPNLDLGDLPATVTLAAGEQLQIGGTIVRFAAVTGDSRCPSDVVCVWEGNAELEFGVGPAEGRGPEHQLKLNTRLEPRSGSARGFKLTVQGLSPTPVSNRPTRGYRVEIRVERVAD